MSVHDKEKHKQSTAMSIFSAVQVRNTELQHVVTSSFPLGVAALLSFL